MVLVLVLIIIMTGRVKASVHWPSAHGFARSQDMAFFDKVREKGPENRMPHTTRKHNTTSNHTDRWMLQSSHLA